MFALWPMRSTVIWSTTARGSTSSRSCMNVPGAGSLKGPKVSGALAPITSWNQSTASAMSGTVRPTWSMPTSPSRPRPSSSVELIAARAFPAPRKDAPAATAATFAPLVTKSLRGISVSKTPRAASSRSARASFPMSSPFSYCRGASKHLGPTMTCHHVLARHCHIGSDLSTRAEPREVVLHLPLATRDAGSARCTLALLHGDDGHGAAEVP